MDRLDAMQVLLAVVDEGSISAGSRKLRSPLPSVSRKVSELEKHLGTQLLIRTSRNIQLTDAGRDYVEAARQIVEQIQDAELRASGEYERPSGALRITTTIDLGRRIVLPLACEFLREHPDITLEAVTANRFVDLFEEHIDVAVRIGQLADSPLFAIKVGSIRAVTCASPEYLERRGRPTTVDDLVEHDVIQFLNMAWTLDGRLMPENWSVRVHATDASVSCTAALQGLGIARLPDFLIAEELASGALVEVLSDFAPEPLPVHLIYVKQGLLPLKVRAFLDWMTPRLRERLKEVTLAQELVRDCGAPVGELIAGIQY